MEDRYQMFFPCSSSVTKVDNSAQCGAQPTASSSSTHQNINTNEEDKPKSGGSTAKKLSRTIYFPGVIISAHKKDVE
ncbi:PREDICTED: uncharacterized protein LOC104723246 isoform X2 [Camelina sativa]|uniref:Uncharacterized protein LOC104723246 isoform X2 n=1 Tax=Camelina sativa TaxID=90675 RepID=A0ABM0UE98_CAMSA|nr:PREDICTED: uncharacterized protein LOC104723246 isoform X2 [Camelina sativa]